MQTGRCQHLLRSNTTRLFRGQPHQRFGRKGYVPMLLKQIDGLAVVQVGTIDFFLISGRTR